MKKIAVFCGSSSGFNFAYKQAAISLAKCFVKNNITLVYGGGKVGLMGFVANTVMNLGGKVIGVIPKLLEHEEVINRGITEIIITKTMSERKVIMSKLCDGYITLPGGFGTMDELFEALTLSQLQIEQKPNGILNVNGYFNALISQLDIMVQEGFLKQENKDSILISNSGEDLLKLMHDFSTSKKQDITHKIVRNDN